MHCNSVDSHKNVLRNRREKRRSSERKTEAEEKKPVKCVREGERERKREERKEKELISLSIISLLKIYLYIDCKLLPLFKRYQRKVRERESGKRKR